eukprot:GHVS01053579.1.p1 GENE.GHVS01053579.1~~GHVS01053579.1.p1  ORF type:complete len:879 (+),score=148.29 GHVS01053579.1:45-2639(+)
MALDILCTVGFLLLPDKRLSTDNNNSYIDYGFPSLYSSSYNNNSSSSTILSPLISYLQLSGFFNSAAIDDNQISVPPTSSLSSHLFTSSSTGYDLLSLCILRILLILLLGAASVVAAAKPLVEQFTQTTNAPVAVAVKLTTAATTTISSTMTPQQIGEEYAAATRDTNNGNTNTIINAQSTTSSRQLDENSTAALITSQQHNTHASANAAYTHEAVVISHENISSDSSKQLLDQSSLSCSAPSSPFSSIVPLNLFSPSSRDKLPTGQLGEMHFVGSARIEPINRRLLLGAEEDVVGGAREVEKKAVLDEEAEEQRNGISHGGTQQQQQGAPGGDMTLRRWSLGGLPREGLNEFDSYGTTSCSILGRDRVVVESVVTDDTKCLRNNTMSGTIDLVSSSASSDMSSSYSSSPSSSSSSGSFPASSSSSCSSYHKDPPPFSAANLVDSARVCVRDNTRGLMKRNVMLACVFTANTLTSIYTGIRCVRTRTIAEHEMPWSGVLSGLIVLWTNLEFGLLKRLVFSLTKDEGLLFPKLHLHKIHYQARLPGHSCDMCGDRIRGEAYRCRVCDFDCCLDCFKKQGKDKAEGLLRSDKGPHFEEYMSTWRYFLGAVGLMRPFAWLVCGACLCVVLTQGFNLMLPTIQGYIMDDIVRKDMQQFGQSVIQLVIFSSLSGLFGGVQKLMVGLVQRNLSVETRLRLFLTVLHQDVAFFDGLMTGQIISRVILDANAMVEPVGVLLNIFLSNVLVVLGGLVLCLYTSWKLTVLAFTSIGPIMYLTGLYSQWSRSLNRDIYEAYAEVCPFSRRLEYRTRSHEARCAGVVEHLHADQLPGLRHRGANPLVWWVTCPAVGWTVAHIRKACHIRVVLESNE